VVENSGKTLRTDTVKPVNIPDQVQVKEDTSGRPVSVSCSVHIVQSCTGYKKGIRHKEVVTDILDRWRIDDEWWRSKPVSRLYYAVLFASGQRMVLYKDLVDGRWYRVF
jgi:hypothetical protein